MFKRGGFLLVLAVIALVIAAGIYLAIVVRGGGAAAEDAAPTTAATVPVQPGGQSSTISLDNRTVVLNRDPNQVARLLSEGGVTPTPVPTPQPTATPPVAQPQDGQGGVATATPPPPTATTAGQPGAAGGGGCNRATITLVNHSVAAGETLYSIARLYATSVALMADCGIATDDLIVGSVIRVPVAAVTACPGRRSHIVLEGENVFRIAQRYNTTSEQLRTINALDANYTIQIGQVLCVP